MLSSGIVTLVMIPSNVIFNILGNRTLKLIEGIFNDDWLEEEQMVNCTFDLFYEGNMGTT
jgi:hypothetical protein